MRGLPQVPWFRAVVVVAVLVGLLTGYNLLAGATGQITHASQLIDTAQCLRTYELTATFEKPAAQRKPVDLVIVQDASGSFQDTIGDVKSALKNIVNNLGNQDRVQLTIFRGAKGYITSDDKRVNLEGWPDWPWEVSTKRTLTKLDSNNNRRNVRNAIDGFAVDGGTPTASGLVRALNSYESAKGNTSGRQTIFVLITDGVANARYQDEIGRRTYEGYIRMRD